jgi:hypothetical protein
VAPKAPVAARHRGSRHGKLIYARFGKFWGTFSVADLFIINAVTIVVEFIGVEQAFSFFGLSNFWSVFLSAILLFAVMAGRDLPLLGAVPDLPRNRELRNVPGAGPLLPFQRLHDLRGRTPRRSATSTT